MQMWREYLKWLAKNPQEPQLCECDSGKEITAQCLNCGKWLCNSCSPKHDCLKKEQEGRPIMQNDKNKSIYQASDRNYPLNEMRQDLVDNWLNDKGLSSSELLEYELTTIRRTEADKECDQWTEENQDGTFRP